MSEIVEKIKRYFRCGKIKYIKFKRSRFVAVMKKVIRWLRLKMYGGWERCTKYENIRIFLSLFMVALFIVLIAIMLYSPVEKYFAHLTGICNKSELLEFIGWGISGLIATLVAVGLLQRTAALDEQNKITKEGQDKGHIHERFKAATDHLGNERASVRIAAFNEFYRLAELNQELGLKKTIFGILCAHLRQTTKHENYQKKEEYSDTAESRKNKPTEEVQSLLDILFKPNKENELIFVSNVANLEGVYLQGANLQEVNLEKANLKKTNLKKVNLKKVNLKKTNLFNADLQGADLRRADLRWADLRGTDLRNADLREADMRWTYLQDADLRCAKMRKADLRCANLRDADLRGTNLLRVDLRGGVLRDADLRDANLRGVKLRGANLRDADLRGAKLREAKLREANLRGANLKNAKLQDANLQDANLQKAKISEDTTIPKCWKEMVKKDKNGKTGVVLVDMLTDKEIESY